MTRKMDELSTSEIIDLRDVTDRVEELRAAREEASETEQTLPEDDAAELAALASLLDELRGCGGDHQWEGDWYPGVMIARSYFKTYAQELAEDIGAINSEARWPAYCIDWDRAADDLEQDYSEVTFAGSVWLYR
jgi:hypothetical protein